MALEALRGNRTVQEIAAKHQLYTKQANTWKRSMIQRDHPELSISQQCKLVQLSRSALYHTSVGIDADTLAMRKEIDRMFTKYPFFHCSQAIWDS